MRKTFFSLVALIAMQPLFAQDSVYFIGFLPANEFSRHPREEIIIPVRLSINLGKVRDSGRVMIVTVNKDKSTLPASELLSIDNHEKTFEGLRSNPVHTVYLRLKPDSLPDRARQIVLNLETKFNGRIDTLNKSPLRELTINLAEIKLAKPDSSLKGYRYLAYIGTNFDLVDRVKVAELFFATNVFLPPREKKGVGFYLNLYGNRTMISTDSTPEVRKENRLVALSDTSYRLFSSQMSLVRTIQSDNLGAFCSPLIKLGAASNTQNALQLYLTPTLEFIWRRTHINQQYSNARNIDSVTKKGYVKGTMDYSDVYKADFNEFVFNAGVGVMVVHETPEISVRVHGAVGYSNTFTPLEKNSSIKRSASVPDLKTYEQHKDVYFSGRAWITESSTGLTLQAEVTNTMINSRPFYGVTLSKAISFTKLGNIFQPLAK